MNTKSGTQAVVEEMKTFFYENSKVHMTFYHTKCAIMLQGSPDTTKFKGLTVASAFAKNVQIY